MYFDNVCLSRPADWMCIKCCLELSVMQSFCFAACKEFLICCIIGCFKFKLGSKLDNSNKLFLFS